MKNIISILIFAIVCLLTLPSEGEAQTPAQWNQKYIAMAIDSAIVDADDQTSKVVTLWNSPSGGTLSQQVNYLSKAYITVAAFQTNDSVRANVYLVYGQNIASGTLGKDYWRVWVDSLYKGIDSVGTRHMSTKIDISSYTSHPQVAVYFKPKGYGNGYLPKWRAYFGGIGYDVKLTPSP